MRRFIARIALLAVCSLGFISITGAAPASAANCTTSHGYTYWNGYLNFEARTTSCTGVDYVEFKRSLGCCVYTWNETGWGDGTEHDLWGWPGNHPAPAAYNASEVTVTVIGGAASYSWRTPSWCAGQVHWVFTQFVFRLHNSVTHTWGSYYTARSPGYQSGC